MKRARLCLLVWTLCLAFATAGNGAGSATEHVEKHVAVFKEPPRLVPTEGMPDGPLLGNGDVGVVVAGPPEAQRLHIGKNDFWRRQHGDASIMAVGAVSLSIPALRGGSYGQEQDLARAEVRGVFTKDGLTVKTRSWVDANENLLVTLVSSEGSEPAVVTMTQVLGAPALAAARLADNGRRLNIGREQYGGGRWHFDGVIDDVRIWSGALSAEDVGRTSRNEAVAEAPVLTWPANSPSDTRMTGGLPAEGRVGRTVRFDGKSAFVDLPAPRLEKALSIAVWIKAEAAGSEANYVVSKGEWNQAYSLGLSNGRVRWAVGGAFLQTDGPLELHKWVHVTGTFDGRRMCLYVDGRLEKRLGGAGEGSHVEEASALSWFTRKADGLPGRSREVSVVTRVVGDGVRADGEGGLSASLEPGRTIAVVSAVRSDLDAPDFLEAAWRRVSALQAEDLEMLKAGHRKWWGEFWGRSFLEIPDQEIEKRWYAALYVMGSCSRAGKVAPGLWGNWITTDRPNWHGDYHLNYNFQAPYYIVYSANHADLSMPFYQAIRESMANGRAMARRHGWKGVHFPVCIGPWGLSPEDPDQDWGQRSDAAFAALNFIWHYQYTQDAEFLRTTAYPYLREVADFWEDYLKFENGRYVIHNDSIHEGSGPDMNPLLSLGLTRTLFKNLIQMSAELGVDAERRGKWRDIREKLSAFPLQERGGKTVFRYSEKGMAWCDGNTLGIHHIFPAGAIGLESDPKLLRICHDTIAAMSRWHDNNGFASWYTACARVGHDPEAILANLRRECDHRSYPNLLLYYGGGGIENVAGFLALNEMLLQSHEGVLRFFPVWPKAQNARFGGLRAVGAFLVSAELKDGIVSGVKIRSEKGRDCTVQNPWPGRKVSLLRNGHPGESMAGERFLFKTGAGETIELLQD